jgi:HlyD family secretion protein
MDVKIEKSKGLKRKHIIYIILGILLLIAGIKLYLSSSLSSSTIDRSTLYIANVTQGKFDDYITIDGTVAPISTVYMDAYEGGRVTEKLIDEGATVKKGDIILKLENVNLYEQILASESNLALKQNDLRSTKLTFDSRQVTGQKALANSEYELQQFRRNYSQNVELYADELISKEEYLRSKEKFELAEKQYKIANRQANNDEKMRSTSFRELDEDLNRMQRTLKMVYERLDHLNVRVPVDGQLGFLDAEVGQNIDKGDRIGQINILTNYKIEAMIDEHYIDRIKRDLSATLERNNTEYKLKVRKVYPEVRNGKFKIDLIFISEKPETIRSGQSYNIKLQLGASNDALLIPKGNFYQKTGGQWIFVMNEDQSEATRKFIKIGKQNYKNYEILDGLTNGEKVIVSGYEVFGDSERIIIK